jgi:hypothetical protein
LVLSHREIDRTWAVVPIIVVAEAQLKKRGERGGGVVGEREREGLVLAVVMAVLWL